MTDKIDDKIDAFAKAYRKMAKQVAKTDIPPAYVKLDVSELTAHATVNKHLVWAFRHAVNGEVEHFEATLQDARNEVQRVKERALAKMRAR